MPHTWTFRDSTAADASWMAELRAEVMQPDLERLERFDVDRVRTRFLNAYVPEYTRVIRLGGLDIGLIAVRPEPDALWIEHFYLDPAHQGHGIGGEVLEVVMTERDDPRPFRLDVLQGSAARRLYERHGFEFEHEDPIDVFLVSPAHTHPHPLPARHIAPTLMYRGDTSIAVTDCGGDGPPLILLHGLAGSSRELLPTAKALSDRFRVLLIDQRGHGLSTRRPIDLSRGAFVDDVIAVINEFAPGQKVTLVGQSMGAHTAFLAAAARPDLIDRLVMLEGHVAGSDRPEDATELGDYFASWPESFADADEAREFLGNSPLTDTWINDLEPTTDGLRRRFDADVMRQTITAVHEPRWSEWETLTVPTLAIFAENGMFSAEQKNELIRRRPATHRADIAVASHDAHLDAFDAWIAILRDYLAAAQRKG